MREDGVRVNVDDVIEQLIGRLGPPSSRRERETEWGVDGTLPNTVVRQARIGVILASYFEVAGGVAHYRPLCIAESLTDHAGMIVRDELREYGTVVSLELAVEVAARLMGKARMSPGAVMGAITGVLGMDYTREENSATWTNGSNSVTIRREPDDTCTVLFHGEHGELTHVIAETTSTPAVIECKSYVDVLYVSGSCTLAVAVNSVKTALREGPRENRAIGRFP